MKSLPCFSLNNDVSDILNYRTNYLLRKGRKKAVANKQDCWNKLILIVTFNKIAIKYESQLKT